VEARTLTLTFCAVADAQREAHADGATCRLLGPRIGRVCSPECDHLVQNRVDVVGWAAFDGIDVV